MWHEIERRRQRTCKHMDEILLSIYCTVVIKNKRKFPPGRHAAEVVSGRIELAYRYAAMPEMFDSSQRMHL
jgi:hypothetical protein